MKPNDWIRLAVSILLPLAAGALGSLFTAPAIPTWYASLVKPALNPPSWLFAPVWTTLYILMGIAVFLVWKKHSNILENIGMLRVWRWAMALFFIQLALNAVWSPVFFGLQNPGAALLIIALLWVAILLTIISFTRVSKAAAWLLAPYLAWVSFAAYLNYQLWILN